jgi:pimeloyl-ACP methyl ester carboxylesterase
MYYERHGDDGEPLVFVHGYTGDVGDWEHQVAEFSRTHRVLVMDHRGHGRSEAPADRAAYTIKEMARDIMALAEHAGFERYHLVGHSMGGGVAQEIVLHSPGRLLSLTLEDTGPAFEIHKNPAIAKYIEQRFKLAEEQGMAAVADMPGMPDPPHMPPGRREYEKKRMTAMSVDGFIGAWNALTGWEGTRDRAHLIGVATLLIYGELDVGLVEGMKFLGTKIPGAALVEVPEAAHCPQFEQPDIFNEALRRHVERHAGPWAK